MASYFGKELKRLRPEMILFSNDGVHPGADGGNLYASAIARGLEKIRKGNSASQSLSQAHTLPEPLIGSEWDEAEMYIPSRIASFDNVMEMRLIHQRTLFLRSFPAGLIR